MQAITASLERSLQNCSLNHNQRKEGEEKEGSADAHGGAGLRISKSSSESCCPSCSSKNKEYHERQHENNDNNNNVVVVAGCKSCLMYFMVPKQVEDCPKCTGQLLHFDPPLNNNATSPSSSL